MNLTLSPAAKTATIAITLAALGTLLLQTAVDVSSGQKLGASLWIQARFFTNLMILAVALIFALTWRRGAWPGASLPAALTVWIVLVGVIYHALLAADHDPEGWDVLVNIFQHTAIPLAVLGTWALLAPKAGLGWRDAVIWLGCPIGYAAYAILRGLLDGAFPYFFLNPVKSGWLGVGLYVIGIGVLFLVTGLLLVALARVLARR
ncbi:Integral membrane protein [Candidatus Rhodobacter oscarellae]|uniref:Integral membrane protein n=1 Tax=Candidatus Rhodobacter oscarellae TaxID=1675527 RepID=A0A0J9E6X9_9RHOB|nr:Pr6Pr family membrane protein [Candidatus Rhodobacter lobularis]KMW58525.1 Integral membrane protein [Candidatus Rhodobacter lobularis]